MIVPETWKWGAIAAGALFLTGVIGVLTIARANLKAELAEAQANVALYQSANDDWAAQAQKANAAIDAAREKAAKRMALAKKDEAKAERFAEDRAAKAKALLEKSVSGDECAAARALVQDYVKRRQ